MQTVIVSGASGNLGSAVVEKYLAKGARVVGIMTREHKLPFGNHERFVSIIADLAIEEEANNAFERIRSISDHLDIAVLTAGGFNMSNIVDSDEAAVRRMMDINFMTAYNIARPIFNHMRKQGSGHIFFIGAKAGLEMNKSALPYSLSKSLLFRLAEIMNVESESEALRTSVIVPDTIDTPQNRVAMPDSNFDSWVKPAFIADIIDEHASSKNTDQRNLVIEVYGNS